MSVMETVLKEKKPRYIENHKPITDPELRKVLEEGGTTFDAEDRPTNLRDAFDVLDEFDEKLIALYGEEFRIRVNSTRHKHGLRQL
jgi:hypothetical protein